MPVLTTDPAKLIRAFIRLNLTRHKPSGREMGRRILLNPELLTRVAPLIDHPDRRIRAASAEALADCCQARPELGLPYLPLLHAALKREEKQTRWEALRALAALALIEPKGVRKGLRVIEAQLLDPESATVRASAARALGRLSAHDSRLAKKLLPRFRQALKRWPKEKPVGALLAGLAEMTEGPAGKKLKSPLHRLIATFTRHRDPHVRRLAQEILARLE